MNDFVIITDSGCDISAEILASRGIRAQSLTFRFTEEDKEYKNEDLSAKDFYDRMRNGAVAKTSAINIEGFKEIFREELIAGHDVLYLGFSSGLSNTYNAGRLAAEELLDEFPDRRVIAVDTLCASAGQGLLVMLAADKKDEGAGIEDVARYVMDIRLKLCHWFTVDDLKYLKRGGRVSPTAAFVGGVLNIKPVMHVDDEGHLINVSKVRGRKTALRTIADKYSELALDKNGTVYISHGDCPDDVAEMKALLEEKGADVQIITDVGSVIGSHSGPGTLAVFFLGSKR
ncbi:MAG: DegV family protein [Oscillospiraceae bacterium]|nr:DegV family protein [Oscillospiraceae bacterium]